MDRLNDDPRSVVHPGETVLEYLGVHEWSQSELARRTDLTPKTISEISNGKAPITPATALAFEKVLGRPAHFWLNLQRRYDEAQARAKEIERSESWRDWAARFPLKEMARRGWFDQPGTPGSEVSTLLRFLGVSSPESWGRVWSAARVSYRQTRKFTKSVEAVSAWVRATELAAADLSVSEFRREQVQATIERLRRLTREPVDRIMEPAQELCASAGIALVFMPELPKTGISGCVRWLGSKKVLVALSFRYKTDDQLWFTFFHEFGHVLLHLAEMAFVLDNPEDNVSDRIVDPEMQRVEDEANRFAADTLVPPAKLAGFIKAKDYGNDAIHDFAEEVGVGPGIVVGRLQHDGIIAQHQGNALKQKIAWKLGDDA
jgi:HTH-type transcriptional regulator/antitoxin HigA